MGLLAGLSSPCLAGSLRVATFECDVTPPVGGHPLFPATPAKKVETPLSARGVVIDDGANRHVLCAVDWCGLCNSSHELFRAKLAKGAGTDVSRVALHCVHQHTAPYTDGDAQKILAKFPALSRYVDFEFLDAVADRLADAAKESLGRLKPFDRVGSGEAKVDRVASYRRLTVDGKIVSRWSTCKEAKLRDLPEGPIDPMLKTITLASGETPLVRLHYYATHPQTHHGDAIVSSDMPGHARAKLEEKEGVFQIYFTGCAGDITMGKYNDGSVAARQGLADRLLAGMEAAVAATRYQPADAMAWRTVSVRLPLQTDKGYTPAEQLARLSQPKLKANDRLAAAWRWSFNQRADKPFELTSLSIGDVHVVHLCGECMVDFQLYAQRQRPEGFVAVAAYGDLAPGYVCTDAAFDQGGYEPSAAGAGRGSEAVMKNAIRELLKQ